MAKPAEPPAPRQQTEPADRLGELVARVVAEESGPGRTRALRALAGALATSARAAGAGAVGSGRWLAEVAADVAPRIPVRDAQTLSRHFDGLTGLDLAAALISSAARTTTAIGAGAGAVMTAEWAAPPTLLTSPAVIAAETLAQVAVELKLVAELHEALGRTPTGSARVRAVGYLTAWARQRGLDPLSGSLPAVLSGAARRELRRRLARRLVKGSVGLAPVAGALVGGALNHRETRALGERVLADLR